MDALREAFPENISYAIHRWEMSFPGIPQACFFSSSFFWYDFSNKPRCSSGKRRSEGLEVAFF
jgi:hypothetical protein